MWLMKLRRIIWKTGVLSGLRYECMKWLWDNDMYMMGSISGMIWDIYDS